MALQTPDELRAFASGLTAAADGFHARLMNDADAGKLSDQDMYEQAGQERMLRDKANSLHLEAAKQTVQGLTEDQQRLTASIDKAAKVIKELNDLKKVLAVVADLIALAGSVVSGKSATIVVALKGLRDEIGESGQTKGIG